MNSMERKMVEVLTDLRQNHGVTEVKAEFESEGSRLSELMRLKDIASSCGVGLVLKIGGPEAIRDIYDAMLLGVSSIVAPMVESAYALKKFIEAIEKNVRADARGEVAFAVNIETNQAFQNFDQMLALPGIRNIARITVGRVDLSGSLGLSKDKINSEEIFAITKTICEKAKRAGLSTTIGGGISLEAITFIQRLLNEKLIDRFETRKIVFDDSVKDIAEAIRRAGRFELLWLCNKHDLYNDIAVEDKDRIRMLEMRFPL